MMTSAQGLLELLTLVSMKGDSNERFLSLVAETLGLTSEDKEAEALLLLSRSIRSVKNDIEGLSFPEPQKNLLREKINAFQPIYDFQHAHLTNTQMRQNCLNPNNLVGLTFIHMSLAGFRPVAELDKVAHGLSEEFRSMREDILKTELPRQLKDVILLRLNQIAAALDHFAFFGTQKLEQEFAALVGEIVIHKNNFSHKQKNLLDRLKNLLIRSTGAVAAANEAVEQGKTALENGVELYLGFSDLIN